MHAERSIHYDLSSPRFDIGDEIETVHKRGPPNFPQIVAKPKPSPKPRPRRAGMHDMFDSDTPGTM